VIGEESQVTLERVLITGIAGFIGSTLAEYLLARYPSILIVGIDRFTDYYPRSIKMANVAERRGARC
jgi:UDP-glucuronate 4-epimerase